MTSFTGTFEYYDIDDVEYKTLDILTPFVNKEVKHPILDMFIEPEESTWQHERAKYADTNLWLLWDEIDRFNRFDYDESEYKRAMINILKLRLVLYATSCYFRSRIGYDMWFFKSRAHAGAYLPLTWEDIYEPDRWYQPGEPPRDEAVQRVWSGGHNPPRYLLPKRYTVRHLPKR